MDWIGTKRGRDRNRDRNRDVSKNGDKQKRDLKKTDKERKENKKRSGTRSNNIRDGNMGRGTNSKGLAQEHGKRDMARHKHMERERYMRMTRDRELPSGSSHTLRVRSSRPLLQLNSNREIDNACQSNRHS